MNEYLWANLYTKELNPNFSTVKYCSGDSKLFILSIILIETEYFPDGAFVGKKIGILKKFFNFGLITWKESFSIKNKSNILCLGEVDYFDLLGIYKLVDFLIFPSTSESFGLPLLEAKFNNTKIIASNLEYVYDVCNPTFVFDPYEPRDIFEKLQIVLKETKKS